MKVSALVLLASLFSINPASADTPEHVLETLRHVFGMGNGTSQVVKCKDGFVSKSHFSFQFVPSSRVLLVTIANSTFGNYLWHGHLLFLGVPGQKLEDGFNFVESEILENSRKRLVIRTKLAVSNSVVDQRLHYDKTNRIVYIDDGRWLMHELAMCQLE